MADGGGAAVLQPESVPRVHREERPDRDREAEAATRGECEAEKTITSFGVFVGTCAFEVGYGRNSNRSSIAQLVRACGC